MAQEILKVVDIKKYFPIRSGIFRKEIGNVKAVDGVSFHLDQGEVLGVVGESGCGKSTTARTVIRLIEPTSGEIYWDGEDLLQYDSSQMNLFRQEVQMIFQDPYASLNPRKSVGESIGEGLLYHGLVENQEEMWDRVTEIMQQIGLSPDGAKRYPHQFSGGQQQRICIGRAIAMKPQLIVCDEAVSALDVSVQAQILNLLSDLKELLGLSYLFISHDLSVVNHISDRVLVMNDGKVVEEGTVDEVFESPQESYTQKLLAAIPRSHPRKVLK